jgi:hypothetical protein
MDAESADAAGHEEVDEQDRDDDDEDRDAPLAGSGRKLEMR